MFAPNTKVLVVDDMLTMRKLVSRSLKDLGLGNITEADDGETAWPLLEAAAKSGVPFQLVISDWNMPKLPGIELLKKVRANELTKTVPFMFITAEAEMSQVMEAIKSGTSNYITKPFTPATLKEKLTAVYNSTRPKQA
ncbi:MAG: response regulator [Oligoflexia bacterium]|jgi:two-component system chemotaxis response regulator CheY